MNLGEHDGFQYPGRELELFADARRWRAYWQSRVVPKLGDHVLEVGAGIGSITADLAPSTSAWTALEPDRNLADRIPAVRTRHGQARIVNGTIADLDPNQRFDTVLYVDVLEHIKADADELAAAAQLLRTFGRLIVLVPAYQFLYSPFDASVGHHRRYSPRRLRAIAPPSLQEVRIEHLDALGFIAAAVNRLVLRQEMPVSSQIRLWDRVLVPISRIIDPVIFRSFGKSLVAVWERIPEDGPDAEALAK